MANRKKEYPWEKKYPKDIKWNQEFEQKPLHSILDEAARKFPNKICANYYGKKYTYLEILEAANKMAKGLQENGVAKGTKIGLLMPNCPQFIISYFAVLKVGAIVVNYNPLYTTNELAKQVNDSGTSIIVTLDLNLLYKKTSNLLQTTCLDRVITAELKASLPFPKNIFFSILRSKEIASIPFNRVNISANDLMDNDGNYQQIQIDPKEDAAVLQYTGGTTGTPKGAILTHANLYANTMQIGMWFNNIEEGEEKNALQYYHFFMYLP